MSLTKAPIKCGLAKVQLADDIHPGRVRPKDKLHRNEIANQTFATVALTREYYEVDFKGPAYLPRTTIHFHAEASDILITIQHIEAHGAIESAHRVRQICRQNLE